MQLFLNTFQIVIGIAAGISVGVFLLSLPPAILRGSQSKKKLMKLVVQLKKENKELKKKLDIMRNS